MKFNFKNSCTVHNTIKFVKKTLLEKYVIDESNNINKEEIQVNIWPNLEKDIEGQTFKITKKIFSLDDESQHIVEFREKARKE